MSKEKHYNIIKFSKDFIARRNAADYYVLYVSKGDEEEIFDLLRNEDDSSVYIPLINALGRMGSEKALDYLIANLNHKRFDQYCLGNIQLYWNEKALKTIADVILNNKKELMRDRALQICEKIGVTNFTDVLIEAFKREKVGYIQSKIIALLGKTKSEKAIEVMRQILLNSKNRIDRHDAITSLFNIGTDRAYQVMTTGLSDEDHYVVQSAEAYLGGCKSPNIVNYLEPILKNPKLELRNSIVKILGNIKSKKALELLLFVANNDSNPSLRVKANSLAQDLEAALNQGQK